MFDHINAALVSIRDFLQKHNNSEQSNESLTSRLCTPTFNYCEQVQHSPPALSRIKISNWEITVDINPAN